MLEHVKMSLLADYYGGLLTEHQLRVVRGVYDEDLSLNELAEELGTSRQAVHDILKRASAKLLLFEKKLSLVGKITGVVSKIEELMVSLDTETAEKLGRILDDIKEI